MSDETREALSQAKEKLQEQDEILKALAEDTLMFATVVSIDKSRKRVVVAGGNGLMEVGLPPKLKLAPGSSVGCIPSGGILSVNPPDGLVGDVGSVVRVIGDSGTAEIEVGGAVSVAAYGGKLEKSDRVVVDKGRVVIMRNLGQPPKKPVAKVKAVTWDDIGGQEAAKAALIEAIELPEKHPAVYRRYSQPRTKGVLLYGPPGNGKTMLAKAAMNSIATAHGQESGHGFIYVKGPEILNMYVGQSEANVRSLFDMARAHKAEHGYPAIIFIDEAEAVLAKRGSDRVSGMSMTVVPAFLAEMDGLDESAAIVILATNRQDTLDPAIVRDGRVDRKIMVPRPDKAFAEEIFKIHLASRPMTGGVGTLAKHATTELFQPTRGIYNVRYLDGTKRTFGLCHVASGAMIAGCVNEATRRAMQREIASGKRDGITAEDLTHAVEVAHASNSNIDVSDELKSFTEEYGQRVEGIDRAPRQQATA